MNPGLAIGLATNCAKRPDRKRKYTDQLFFICNSYETYWVYEIPDVGLGLELPSRQLPDVFAGVSLSIVP